MSAPERIYLQWYGDGDPEWDNEEPECADVTWATERIYDADIVYRRARVCTWWEHPAQGVYDTSCGHEGKHLGLLFRLIKPLLYCPTCGGRIEVAE